MTTLVCGATPPGCFRQDIYCNVIVGDTCRVPPCEAGWHHPSATSTLCIVNPPVHNVPVPTLDGYGLGLLSIGIVLGLLVLDRLAPWRY